MGKISSLSDSMSNLRYGIKAFPYSFSLRPYSNILFVSDGYNWVLGREILELTKIAKKLDIHARYSGPIPLGLPRQSIFFASKVMLNHPRRYLLGGNRIAFPYYHGYPDSGERVFVERYEILKRFHRKICRIQVTHSRMYDLILSTGIAPYKVFLIPIGINMDFFQRQTPESRKAMRDKYKIPQQALLIGSFQKDGTGWGEGNIPKLIKGPDVFIKAVNIIRKSVPDVFVLLSGPARGYVKKGLERLKIPYKHIYLDDYTQIGELYQCLDLYIIASREEGGPRAVLESMASGVPLVTTRVGQAMDLVIHGKNAFMVEVEDAEGLIYWAERILSDTKKKEEIVKNGIITAQENTYSSQIPLWKDFFKGFLNIEL